MIDSLDVAQLLPSLVDRSLVAFDEITGRYRMLESVQVYAQERLAQSGDLSPLTERYRDYYLELSEEAAPQVYGPDQADWLRRLEAEHDNLRAGLRWSLRDLHGAEPGLRLACALWRFWSIRGHYAEARQWLDATLKSASEAAPDLRAKGLNAAGRFARDQGDYSAARALYHQALVLMRHAGDTVGLASSLHSLGELECDLGNYQAAEHLLGQCLEVQRDSEDKARLVGPLAMLGTVVFNRAEYPHARTLFEESLAISRMLNDKAAVAAMLTNLGNVAQMQGDDVTSAAMYRESTSIQRELGHMKGVAYNLYNLAEVLVTTGDHAQAAACCEEALVVRRKLGDKEGIAWSLTQLGQMHLAGNQLPKAQASVAEGLKLFRDLGVKRGVATAMESIGEVKAYQGSTLSSVRCWGAAAALRKMIGCPPQPDELGRLKRSYATARNEIGERAYAAAWRKGREMTLDQAIAYALDEEATT